MCCIFKCLALCFVCCSVIIWRNLLSGLMGPLGKDGSSWENFKNLRLRRNSWYGLGDIVKLFMCRKLCGHGTFLFLLGQIPLLCSLQAAGERLEHSHWGRVSDTEEGGTGNLSQTQPLRMPAGLPVVDLTNLNVLSCLVQTNKCKTDLLKVLDAVEWSGLKF